MQREELHSFVWSLQTLPVPKNDGLCPFTINENHKYYSPLVISLHLFRLRWKLVILKPWFNREEREENTVTIPPCRLLAPHPTYLALFFLEQQSLPGVLHDHFSTVSLSGRACKCQMGTNFVLFTFVTPVKLACNIPSVNISWVNEDRQKRLLSAQKWGRQTPNNEG